MDWESVFAQIDERRDELALTKSRLYQLSGVSERTFQKMAAGTPLARKDKRIGICRALRWSDDSIDRMLKGGPPLTWEEELYQAEHELSHATYEAAELGGDEDRAEFRRWQYVVDELRRKMGLDELEVIAPPRQGTVTLEAIDAKLDRILQLLEPYHESSATAADLMQALVRSVDSNYSAAMALRLAAADADVEHLLGPAIEKPAPQARPSRQRPRKALRS